MIAHDFKLPIQNLKITADEKQKAQLAILEDTINNLLVYSKIKLKQIELKLKPTNLKAVINPILKLNFAQIINKELNLQIEVADVQVLTDEYWLSFIIRELISNAIKYSDQQLTIEAYQIEDDIVITIVNDGQLIVSNELDQIFEKAYIGSNTKINATGYGLYYATVIAKKLNYKLGYEVNNGLNQFKLIINNH